MLVPLTNADKPLITEHYLRLSPEDRYLRFFVSLPDAVIKDFVNKVMDLENGVAFGIMEDGELVGVGYVGKSTSEDGRVSAEAGFSIDVEYRSHGLSTLLMAAIIGYCRGAKIDMLVMSCLRENKRMQKLARNFGLRVVVDAGEAFADLLFKG